MILNAVLQHISSATGNCSLHTFERGSAVTRSFNDLAGAAAAACDRLAACGVVKGMRVGIRARNRYEWLVYDLALLDLRAVCVAFTSDFDSVPPEQLCRTYGLSLLIDDIGKKRLEIEGVIDFGTEIRPVREGAHCATEDPDYDRPGLIFSSGSAGGIKGLTLNRRGIEDCVDVFTHAAKTNRTDRLLVFLPLSNFQQRLMCYAAFWYGFDIVLIEPHHLFRALEDLAPSILIAPPAFFETIESRFDNLPPHKRRLAYLIGGALTALPTAGLRQVLARRIFRQAYDALGGNLRLLVTGMAPIKRSTLNLFALMQLPLFETYGLIESGSVSLNLPGRNKRGSVGQPLPGVHVSFAEDGEIIVTRDHPIAVGYFQCAEGESESTFLEDGIATGDIGRVDSDGFLYLVGRKKDMIVTPGGEKLHPAVVEADIAGCPDVDRALVFARRSSPNLAAVVVPKGDGAAVEERISKHVDGLNANHWRNITVDKLVFTNEMFTRENGFLRPNLKINRKIIGEHFAAAIE